MGNMHLKALEKNNYFYGKLLTVRDFNTEQLYHNEKQHIMNRAITGCGVVSGLKVTMIDDQTLFIEQGMALDQNGRMIVVPD